MHTITYTEEQTFWIYKNDTPYLRKSEEPSTEYITSLMAKNPTARFAIKRETRTVEEVRTFAPYRRD